MTPADAGVTVRFMRETTHTENTSPYEPPNTRRVLELLKEAGEVGVIGPDIARQFTIADPTGMMTIKSMPMANLQRRLTWTNQILDRFRWRGWVVRGGLEPSPYYHNVPTFRWYITESGAGYLAAGMRPGLRAAREAERERRAAELAAWHKRLDDMITQAYMDFDPAETPQCVRNPVMRTLRDAGCTLAAIGGVFDITRERVRQVLAGIKVSPCRCPKCTDQRWFSVGDGEIA